MNDLLIKRVVRKYARKTMNKKIDEAFKTWKGKNSFSKNQIGYWTLKAWRDLSPEDIKDPNKKNKKEYAQRMFKKFEEAILKDEEKERNTPKSDKPESSNQTLEESAVVKLIDKKDYGLPKTFFKNNKLLIKGVKPTEKDVKKLASELESLFKTPGHQKGLVGSFIRGQKFFVKRNAKMMSDLIKDISSKFKKNDKNIEKKIKDAIDSNPEVQKNTKMLAANWTQSTLIPKVAVLLGFSGKLSIGAAIAAKASATAAAVSAAPAAGAAAAGVSAVTAPGWIPFLAGVGVSALVMGHVFKKIVKKVNESNDGKKGYEALAADIYAGYATPESIEKEYKAKMDSILSAENLDPAKKKEEILKLYEDFDTNVRPSIDKGLYLLGESEGSGTKDFLKRGAEGDMPVFLQLKHLKESYEADEIILNTLKEESSEISKEAESLFSGKKEVSKDVMDNIKGFIDAGKKASADRVAVLHLLKYTPNPFLF